MEKDKKCLECIRLGNVYDDEKFNGGNFGGNVWSGGYCTNNENRSKRKSTMHDRHYSFREQERMGKTIQQVIGGLGEKKSNNGTQYFQQDRVYNLADISCCIPSQLPGGVLTYLK